MWPAGFTSVYSAEIAMEKVRQSTVMPQGVEMQLEFFATDCDPVKARETVMTLMERDDIKLFVGPPCRTGVSDWFLQEKNT